MANENCLSGIKCPDCGQEDKFYIVASAEFEVTDDGTDTHSGVGWDNESHIRCAECGAAGKVKHFQEPEPDKPFEVVGYVRKRYTTVIMAQDVDDAVDKGNQFEGSVEDQWDEDMEYYDLTVENARELNPEDQEETDGK